ncbi:efflux RND transporter periplasmic adaptor subunit [Marinifilum caeruleilacunae]|uniref:Efflux RND transporter periplasmic adaptor subunit n=1 Tax=Marinifilum caeruleilacunae TaxID=2499076 RepID=A0ABX1X0F9_9BACT|nr:efflux RND transporter periplasmic adaptor subunit [Marinifilum caeruleilacunae]NOU61889.1 efflux RND transporter periplasmic adaptor subunit [Marinifilum caeruleilacunae]
MNSKTILLIAITATLAWGFQSCGSDSTAKENQKADVSVSVQSVTIANQPEQLSFTGKVEAETHSNLSTRIMGQIERINVEPGQNVNKGQLLVQIKDEDIQARKAQVKANMIKAEAAYENASKDYKRFSALFEQKSASQKEMDDATTHFNMAKAELEAVKQMEAEVNEMLRYSAIKAPYQGIITRKYVNEGDLASPGMPLVAIEKPGDYKVMAKIPETEIFKIQKNDLVKVKITALNEIVDGKITEVNPSALYTGNQFEAKIVLEPNKDQKAKLFSGMYAQVRLEKGEMPVILVPTNVLVKKGQLTGVYTVSQMGTAMLRWVRVGKSIDDMTEVLSGLSDGEQYIVSYQGKIWDGAKLSIQ